MEVDKCIYPADHKSTERHIMHTTHVHLHTQKHIDHAHRATQTGRAEARSHRHRDALTDRHTNRHTNTDVHAHKPIHSVQQSGNLPLISLSLLHCEYVLYTQFTQQMRLHFVHSPSNVGTHSYTHTTNCHYGSSVHVEAYTYVPINLQMNMKMYTKLSCIATCALQYGATAYSSIR